ncbi:MAG: hypothetical protein J6T10_01285 [Methanobrevibacter sp.]|nr:hypothetical protein [Methanobrevibacter sp.]
MKGYSTKQIIDPWFKMPDDYDELVKVYRTLAKSADQRLVRLESYQHDKNFAPATKWAYARAMHDIESWSGSEASRFNAAPPASKVDLLSKIQDIKHFIESPTSTKKGIIDVYQRRANTINKKYGTKLTWKDLAQYFDSAANDKLDKQFGSKTAIKVYSALKKNQSEILKDIEEKKDLHVKVSDEVLQDTINDYINKHPKEVQQILKSS